MKKIVLCILCLFSILITSCTTLSIKTPEEITLENMWDDYHNNGNKFFPHFEYQEMWKLDLEPLEHSLSKLIELRAVNPNEVEEIDKVILKIKKEIYDVNSGYIDLINYIKSDNFGEGLSNVGRILQGK